ncbi:MAG TPA: hypothetical protein VHW00_08850 [Thermoanaerobaculia bacterium]|nr:hypothetical protein [Thermoanaerobaculia bacterium]
MQRPVSRIVATALWAVLLACNSKSATNPHVLASMEFTTLYKNRMPWKVEGVAAGTDCAVLLVRAESTLTDNNVEAIQYGAPEYGSYEGGIRQFAETHGFRAVAYRDARNTIWTFGATTQKEARALSPCEK